MKPSSCFVKILIGDEIAVEGKNKNYHFAMHEDKIAAEMSRRAN